MSDIQFGKTSDLIFAKLKFFHSACHIFHSVCQIILSTILLYKNIGIPEKVIAKALNLNKVINILKINERLKMQPEKI